MSDHRDITAVLASLGNRVAGLHGREYWQRLEALAQREGLGEYLAHEYGESAGFGSLSRRRFLTLLAASMGIAGVAGCDVRPPRETIVPFVRAPEESLRFATLTMSSTRPSKSLA